MKFKRIWLFIFTLSFVLSCFEGMSMSAQSARKRIWVFTPRIEMESFAVEDTNVYAEPDLKSKIMGRLKKKPDRAKDDVLIVQVKILTDDKNVDYQTFKVGDQVYERWWLITRPVQGWVEGDKLGLYYSGFLFEE